MTARALSPEAVAPPGFTGRFDEGGEGPGEIELFDLPSHAPAREALDLALAAPGHHAFVLGEDGSGRMEATMAHLARHAEGRPPAADWLYLHDFRHPRRPRPLALPPGRGRLFRDRLRQLLPVLAHALRGDLASDARAEQVRAAHDQTEAVLESARNRLRRQAEGHGLDVWRGPQGLSLVVNGSDGKPLSQDELLALPPARRKALDAALAGLAPAMAAMRATARRAQRDLARRIRDAERRLADETVPDTLSELRDEFGAHGELARWLCELQADVLDNLHLFAHADEPPAGPLEALECRYGANLLVDNGDARHAAVVLEADPTAASLFGAVAAHPHGGSCHGAIAAGALHRANGGILVLRADDLGRRPALWPLLKGALRDRAIRVAGAEPPAGRPVPIPLDAKLVLVGAPAHRRLMLAADPGLRAQVKVKAEIAPHMPADDGAVALFARLVHRRARALGLSCRADAVDLLIGQACRWAGHRDRLSARFERAADLLAEAGVLAGGGPVGAGEVERAIAQRRRREGGGEEEALRPILEGMVAIESGGRHVGRANGLLHGKADGGAFGLPLSIAAHRHGGGVAVEATAPPAAAGCGHGRAPRRPMAAVADWLGGLFARRIPLSFSRSPPGPGPWDAGALQLASACAVLSSLAGVPLRQDIAAAGAIDRTGRVLAVDGPGRRVEGFFRLCEARGLSGSQGVIVPAANERHLVLRPEVVCAVRAGRFQLWAVATAAEALELLAGLPAGAAKVGAAGASPPESVLARARAGLEEAGRPPAGRGDSRP